MVVCVCVLYLAGGHRCFVLRCRSRKTENERFHRLPLFSFVVAAVLVGGGVVVVDGVVSSASSSCFDADAARTAVSKASLLFVNTSSAADSHVFLFGPYCVCHLPLLCAFLVPLLPAGGGRPLEQAGRRQQPPPPQPQHQQRGLRQRGNDDAVDVGSMPGLVDQDYASVSVTLYA